MTPLSDTLKEMRDVASRATPGKWIKDEMSLAVYCKDPSPTKDYRGNENNEICTIDDNEYIIYKNEVQRRNNCNHIAMANPENMLKLLDLVEKYKLTLDITYHKLLALNLRDDAYVIQHCLEQNPFSKAEKC